jgi:eukaryotic-like serine/threonine-protein kinase
MSAILREDPPDLSATNKTIAPALERVVNHCLEKNPEERFHSASDLAFAIEALSGTQGSGATTISSVAAGEPSWLGIRRKLFDRIGWIAAALFLLSTIVLAAFYFRRSEPRAETMRFNLPVPEKAIFGDAHALAPDGSRLVFVATGSGGVTSLWVRTLDATVARELPGTENGSFPFWSPDSRFIGFFAGNKLKKIDASGGPAQSLADASAEARGGAWGADGTIVFTPAFTTPLYKVLSAGGAAATPVTQLDGSRKQTSHRWPTFLPDGRRFLYSLARLIRSRRGFTSVRLIQKRVSSSSTPATVRRMPLRRRPLLRDTCSSFGRRPSWRSLSIRCDYNFRASPWWWRRTC